MRQPKKMPSLPLSNGASSFNISISESPKPTFSQPDPKHVIKCTGTIDAEIVVEEVTSQLSNLVFTKKLSI